MKKILFCGGSHMAQNRKLLEKKYNSFDLDFYITASPLNRDWSVNGGRYIVNQNTVSGNGHYFKISKDLSKYDHIVFIGQFIQIVRFIKLKEKKQLLSKSILKAIFHKDSFIYQPGNLYNEPLELFPKLAPDKVILIPDPLLKPEFKLQINLDFIDYFYQGLSLCCESKSIKLFMPDKSLLDDDCRFTKDEYKKDVIHCNTNYWEALFEKFNYI